MASASVNLLITFFFKTTLKHYYSSPVSGKRAYMLLQSESEDVTDFWVVTTLTGSKPAEYLDSPYSSDYV